MPALAPVPLSLAMGDVGPARLGDSPMPLSHGGARCPAAIPGARGCWWPCHPQPALAGEAAGGQLLPRHDGQGCEKRQGAGAAASRSRKGCPRPHGPEQEWGLPGEAGADASRWATPSSGTPWLSSSTCCGWRRWSRRGRWTSFQGHSTSTCSAGQCCRPRARRPVQGSQGPPASPSLLPSRAQEHSRGPSFQSISASGLNAALAHYRYGSAPARAGGARASSSGGERALTPLFPSQPLQREQSEPVCG